MGGQHISRAVWLMHQYYRNTLKVPEEKIPVVYRKVAAEMIKCNTNSLFVGALRVNIKPSSMTLMEPQAVTTSTHSCGPAGTSVPS